MSGLSGLFLCQQSFLKQFNQDWLSSILFYNYEAILGNKNTLEETQRESLDVIILDRYCDYTRNHFICWLRALKAKGLLIVEAIENDTPERWVEKLSHQIFYMVQPNKNVWFFIKKGIELPENIENEAQYLEHYHIQVLEQIKNNQLYLAVNNLLLLEVLEPDNWFVPFTLCRVLRTIGEDKKASSIMDDFVTRFPHHQNRIYQALDYLSTGDYSQGFKIRNDPPLPHIRRTKLLPTDEQLLKSWKGESVKGKVFVIWTEFGLGDEIMFAQLAHYFKQQGVKKLIIIVQTPIVSLLQTHPDIDVVVDYKQAEKDLPSFDYWCYPHDILAFIELPFAQIPKRNPYLFASQDRINKFSSKIALSERLKVGISWRGDPTNENDRYRSIHHLNYIRQLFELQNIDWYCLLKDCNDEELKLLDEFNIPHIVADCEDMADTAAIMSQLDYVITTCNSVGHVAGALGVEHMLLLAYVVDWRWGYKDRTTLWYPNTQLFRNPNPFGDWDTVIKEIKEVLQIKAAVKQLCG